MWILSMVEMNANFFALFFFSWFTRWLLIVTVSQNWRPCAFNYSKDTRAVLVGNKMPCSIFCCLCCIWIWSAEDEQKLTRVDEQSIHIKVGTDGSQDKTARRSKHQCGKEDTWNIMIKIIRNLISDTHNDKWTMYKWL